MTLALLFYLFFFCIDCCLILRDAVSLVLKDEGFTQPGLGSPYRNNNYMLSFCLDFYAIMRKQDLKYLWSYI